ncbi:AAA family ATPase [Streptomyces sp. NPDC056704]|uniref:AAA family ATPase n=1 Tax=Streptomyces sp. NPDC056704 TaxID=3345917 RepID=UPI003687ADD8
MSRSALHGALRAEGLVATVVVDTYDNPNRQGGREILSHVGEARRKFTRLVCPGLGFGVQLRLDEAGSSRQHLWTGVEEFRAHGARRKILYWTGHGVDLGEKGYYLACRDSWAEGSFDGGRAIALTELVDCLLAPGVEAETLLVVDACSSHGHLPQALNRALSKDRETVGTAYREREHGFVVIGTSGVGRAIPEGRWVDWLDEALADPGVRMADYVRPLEPSALYLPVEYLREAVDQRAAASGLDQAEERPGYVEVHSLPNSFLHNPYYNEDDQPHRTAQLHGDDAEPWLRTEHFGLEDGGDLEQIFAGRHGALSRLVRWLDTHSQGLLAVTGPAGSGKTALLGRLALMSVPKKCERLDPPPPPQVRPRPGTIHAVISCHGQSLVTLTRALWQVLTAFDEMAPLPEGATTTTTCLVAIDALVRSRGSLNVIFDGLDEAMPEQAHEIARHLLNPLARSRGVKVVVGTRPQPRQQAAYREPEETLLETLDQTAPALALDEDDETERDIARMVETVLATGSSWAGVEAREERHRAAERIAEESGRLFLVARLMAAELVREHARISEEQLVERIRAGGAGLRERLAQEIRYLGSAGALRAEELLRPLALVQGRGLLAARRPDRRLWLTLANCLRNPASEELTEGALSAVLKRAVGSVVTAQRESTEARSYRLAHPSYGAYLLESARLDPGEGHRRVVETLSAHDEADWDAAHPYVLRYLGAHAAQSGSRSLESLFADPHFLVRTDPDVMLPLVTPLLRESEGAALYARVADRFRFHTEVVERKAILRAAAFVSHRDGLYRMLLTRAGFLELPWRELWTDAPPEPLELRWPAPLGGARAIAWTTSDGGQRISVGGQGEVVVQDARTGKRLLTRRTGDDRGVRRTALTEVRETGAGSRRVTVASDSGVLSFWVGPERTPAQAYQWGGAPHSLTLERCDDVVLAMAADGRMIWAWRWPYRERPADGGLADVPGVAADRIALAALGGRRFLLVAHRGVTLWEVHPQAPHGSGLLGDSWVLSGEGAPAYATAALPDGESRTWLAVADGQTATVWRLSAPVGTLAPGSSSARRPPDWEETLTVDTTARGITLGHLADQPLIALHEGATIRVRGILDTALACSFELSSPREPEALAFDPAGSGLLAAGDGPDVRLLDVASALRAVRRARRRGHYQRALVALAASGEPDGPTLLCQVWGGDVLVGLQPESRPGAGVQTLLHHEESVAAVRALWHHDHWIVAVAAGRQVRIWRLSAQLDERKQDNPLELEDDPGVPVPGLGLTSAGDAVRLFVPERGEVTCWEIPRETAGARAGRRRAGAVYAGVTVMWSCASAMRDGRTWLVTHAGDGFRLWESTPDGLAAASGILGAGTVTVDAVLGEYHVDEQSVPLVAWAEGERVRIAEWTGRRWKPTDLTVPRPGPAALRFSGTPDRPLLLVCGGTHTLSVWDMRNGVWVDELAVPYRGFDVETADAVSTAPAGGITLALQGSRRCDLIEVRPDALPRPVTRRRTGGL